LLFATKSRPKAANIDGKAGIYCGVTERVTHAQTLKVDEQHKLFLGYFRICSASLKSGKLPTQRNERC
jgi:hypothetical protein